MILSRVACSGISLLVLMGATQARTTVASPAVSFLNSLGINTHVAQGYDPMKYAPALRYLGVRAIRDAAARIPELTMLFRTAGVKVDIFNGGNLNALLDAGRQLAAAGALLSLEGPNEPNNFPITYMDHRGGDNETWMPVAAFQRDLYAHVKADPVLRNFPVFHVSEGGAETENVGLQFLTIPHGAETVTPTGTAYADYANAHNYVSGRCGGYINNQAWRAADPTLNGCWDGLYVEYGRTWRRGYRGYDRAELQALPRVTTETGWDSVADPGGESVQGKMLINTYLAQFARGWRYTFIYELGDGEGGGGNQGLFHADWSPKLAATYLHTLTTILADTAPPARPSGLDYAIVDQPDTVHDLLLQKSDGVFYLVAWGEQVRGTNDVTITFANRQREVRIYDVTAGAAPLSTLTDIGDLHLKLSDHAMIVEIRS